MQTNIFPNIPIGKEETKLGEFKLYMSFLHSASHLRASAYDSITKGYGTPEFYQDYLLLSFYLYRHALELGFKTLATHPLISQSQGEHKLKKIWQDVRKHLSKKLQENIQFISQNTWDVIQMELRSISEINNYISDFKRVLNRYIKNFNAKIESSLNILAKNYLLNDEQLFRYERHNNGYQLKTLSSIPQKDCEIIEGAIWAIYNIEDLLHSIIREMELK